MQNRVQILGILFGVLLLLSTVQAQAKFPWLLRVAAAKKSKKIPFPQPLKASFLELDEMSRMVAWLAEQNSSQSKYLELEPVKKCLAHVGEISPVLELVRAERERALKKVVSTMRKSRKLKPAQIHEVEICEKTCTCGAWQDIFAALSNRKGRKLASADSTAFDLVKRKTQNMSDAEALSCARESLRLCDSEIFNTLRERAKK
jgi:hypothetical protein